MNWKEYITEINDFPKKGVSFKDISPLLSSGLFFKAVEEMFGLVETPDYWVGIESRGFIFASSLSMIDGGLVLCRKKGKLPPPIVSETYQLEYGEDTLEMRPGSGRVVIVDDVYASGGTMAAARKLCERAGYEVVGELVLINLTYLNDSKEVKSLITY